MAMIGTIPSTWSMEAGMGIFRRFRKQKYLILALILLVSLFIYVLRLKAFSRDPEEERLIELRKIPVQYHERDLLDYHLYHTELVKHSPVFRFINVNNTFSHESKVPTFDGTQPVVFVITPTYKRGRLQKAMLTNMCTTMRHSTNIFWIIIEDEIEKTGIVKHLLLECGIPTVHMNFKSYFHVQATIDQRNAALQWIKRNTNIAFGKSVFFLADDDNIYHPDIFDEMRYTQKVSVWPVGFAGASPAEGPIVKDGKVVDWMSGWDVKRKFPIDMAGFAVNVQFWYRSEAKFVQDFLPGYSESDFLEACGVETADLEPRADNCRRVLVWHTQQEKRKISTTIQTKNGSAVPDLEV